MRQTGMGLFTSNMSYLRDTGQIIWTLKQIGVRIIISCDILHSLKLKIDFFFLFFLRIILAIKDQSGKPLKNNKYSSRFKKSFVAT